MYEINPNEVTWEWIESDQLICTTCAYIVHAHITPDGTAQAYSTVYDGHNTSGKVLFKMRSYNWTAVPFAFGLPIYASQGIYVTLSDAIDGVLIGYYKIPTPPSQ